MARVPPNLIGQRFGRLVVEKRHGSVNHAGYSRATWFCRCDCGGTAVVTTSNLKGGGSNSCGCLKVEHAADMRASLAVKRSQSGY